MIAFSSFLSRRWQYVTLLYAAATLLIPICSEAMSDESPPLAAQDGELFTVEWQGQTLITGDELQAVPSGKLDAPEGTRTIEQDGRMIYNRWKVQKPHEQVTWRREVARDSGAVEMSIQYRVPAWYYSAEKTGQDSFYRFTASLTALEGMEYQAIVREGEKRTTIKGNIVNGEAVPPIGHEVLYLAFKTPSGKSLSFDLGPGGTTVFNRYVAPNSMPDAWWVKSGPGELKFSIGRFQSTMYPHNGVFLGKVRIQEATFEDHARLHAFAHYAYFMELPAMRQFCFGAAPPLQERRIGSNREISEGEWLSRTEDRWLPVPERSYSEEIGFGWVDNSRRYYEGDAATGVLHGRVKGSGKSTFRLRVPEKGIYLFTVRTPAYDQALGTFSLRVKGAEVVKNLRLKPQELATMTFSAYVDKEVDLELSGNWALSTLAVQKLIYGSEDFTFARGFWLADALPAPTTMYQFERRIADTPAAVQIHALEPNPPRVKAEHPGIHNNPDATETLWRWQSSIASLGPAGGTLYEYETPEQIERRLDELLEKGYRVILVNGYLIRHAFPEEHARMRATMKRITTLAHARGMKVLDHFDLTIIPNMGAAFQQFVENLDWTQRDVRNGQVTRGYCINNPHFRKAFSAMMVEYVREADLDGLMLDEACWHGEAFCGCVHCRTGFTMQTGLVLPFDETSPDLVKETSRLWKEWQLWRTRASGDFGVAVLKEIQKVRPDFIWMKYGAPTVFISNYPTKRVGDRLSEAPRYSHYMGIETLSRNLHATYRSNLAIASIYNAHVERENIPSFSLVYHKHQPQVAYAAWAMNNMNRLLTWTTQGNQKIEEDAPRYLQWKENMDVRTTRAVAEVAVLFSENTRDFGQDAQLSNEELIGFCEQLDDLHIPYRVILDRDLTPERLADYRLLVLPGVSAMSEREQTVIEAFIRSGGNVLATGRTGTEDELGFLRENWLLRPWLGLTIKAGETVEGGALTGDSLQESKMPLKVAPVRTLIDGGSFTKPRHLAALISPEGEEAPGVVQASLGAGTITWTAAWMGAENFEHDGRFGRALKGRTNPAALEALQALLHPILQEKTRFLARTMPKEVCVRVYEPKALEQESPAPALYIHLYNGSGSNLVLNKPVPEKTPAVAFPVIDAPIVFEVRMESDEVKADFVTPDRPGISRVEVEPLGDHRWKITLPSSSLQAYGIVRLYR